MESNVVMFVGCWGFQVSCGISLRWKKGILFVVDFVGLVGFEIGWTSGC